MGTVSIRTFFYNVIYINWNEISILPLFVEIHAKEVEFIFVV